jgi:hypothetical protein
MAIRNVNGRNVYVLEPRQPTGKTTSGRSWATLYSDLRWQVWEEIQKNEAAMLKMELSSAKMRKDYYDDKIKVLQDQRKQLQAAALKAGKGEVDSANSIALRAAQGSERMARQTAGKIVTREVIQRDMFGEPIIDPVTNLPKTISLTTTTEPSGGVSAKAKQVYDRILDDYLAGKATEEDVKAAAADAGVSPATAVPAGPSLDQQIEALDRDLEQLLLQRQAATSGLDANLLRRTREGFAEQVGVMGQGGGMFGLAPRRRRTAPFVQQELAQERIEEFVPAYQAQQRKVEEEQKKLSDLQRAREDVILLITPEEAADRETMSRNEALLAGLNEEIETQKSAVQTAMQPLVDLQAEVTPREPGELLLRDRRFRDAEPRMAQPPRVPSVTAGEPDFEVVPPPPPTGGMEDLGLEPMTDEERMLAEEAVRSVNIERPKPEGELPPVETERRPLPPYERAFEPEPRPAGLGGVPETPVPVGPPIELDEPSAIRNPDILDRSDYIPAPDLIEDARGYFRGMTIQRGDERPKTIRFPERHFGGETEMVKEYLKERIREAAPVGVDQSQEIEAVEAGPPQSSSRQRKDKYKFDVVSEGTKLARTPKKLQRLAKTNLPEENRPEHYVIVDKLYDVNRGKEQSFKMTYDEISRAFQNDPQKRSDAHKYLVAKDILEADVAEPLA